MGIRPYEVFLICKPNVASGKKKVKDRYTSTVRDEDLESGTKT